MSSPNHRNSKRVFYLLVTIFALNLLLNIFTALNSTEILITSSTTELESKSPITNIGFCGELNNKFDKRKYLQPLNDFNDLQFRADNENDRYFIVENFDHWGLTSKINVIHPLLTLSIASNRKFLFSNPKSKHWKWLKKSNGKTIPFKCNNRKGRNCFFKKHSNLNNDQVQELLEKYKENTLTIDMYTCAQWIDDKIDSIDKFEAITANYKIIYWLQLSVFKGYCFFATYYNKKLTKQLIEVKQWKHINYFEFNAMLHSYFFLNLQHDIYALIDTQINDLLRDRYKWISANTTMSLPIRGSDKCRHEMACWSAVKWLQAAYDMVVDNKLNINSLIVSSEDENVTAIIRDTAYKNREIRYVFGEVIFNDFDKKPNTGSPYTIQANSKDDNDMFDSLLSMLVTLKLQLHANYYIIQKQSGWLYAIWLLSSSFNDCKVFKNNDNIQNIFNKQCANVHVGKTLKPILMHLNNSMDFDGIGSCFRQIPAHMDVLRQMHNFLREHPKNDTIGSHRDASAIWTNP